MAHLAEDLLVLAQADAGGVPLRKTENDIGAVLAHVAGRFRPRAAELGRTITVIDDNVGLAGVDRARLEQALGNLVDNALSHGGGEVTMRASRRDGRLELHVLDQGEGFPPEFLPRAFERFSRPHAGRSGRGTGLGLSIVVVVARAHGGYASAINLPTRGSDVCMSLPG